MNKKLFFTVFIIFMLISGNLVLADEQSDRSQENSSNQSLKDMENEDHSLRKHRSNSDDGQDKVQYHLRMVYETIRDNYEPIIYIGLGLLAILIALIAACIYCCKSKNKPLLRQAATQGNQNIPQTDRKVNQIQFKDNQKENPPHEYLQNNKQYGKNGYVQF